MGLRVGVEEGAGGRGRVLSLYRAGLGPHRPVHVAHLVDVGEAVGALAGHPPGGGELEDGVLLRVEVEDGPVVAHLRQQLHHTYSLKV